MKLYGRQEETPKNLYQLNRYHDTIIVYSKKGNGKSVFNPMYFPYDEEYKKNLL